MGEEEEEESYSLPRRRRRHASTPVRNTNTAFSLRERANEKNVAMEKCAWQVREGAGGGFAAGSASLRRPRSLVLNFNAI